MSSDAFRPSAALQPEDQQITQLSPPPVEPPSDLRNNPLLPNDEILPSIEADIPSYPLSRQVLNLERREREAQLKCSRLEEKCRELSSALERTTKEKHEMGATYEARCQLAEAEAISINKQLKKERNKFEELNDKNETLVADLAAASENNTFLKKMLEEKTHESYIFRCAYRVVFKCSLSIKEKCTIHGVLRRVIERCWAERRREVEAQESRDQSRNDEERQLESSTPESSSKLADATEASDSNLGLLSPRSLRKRQLEETQALNLPKASSEDSDEDMPLLNVRKKRAKKAKDYALW